MSESKTLHEAVCQAVAIMNTSMDVARSADGREARDILRQALIAYADEVMDKPATTAERNLMAVQREAVGLETDRAELVEALAELVRLKDLHDRIEGQDFATWDGYASAQDEYKRCKPLAWDAARSMLARIDTNTVFPTKE